MNHPERTLWNNIKKHLPGTADRVENFCCPGMPDVNGSCDGKDYWIELKVSKSKHELPVESLLRESQKVWHHVRSIYGVKIFVIVKYPDAIYTYKRVNKGYKLITYGSPIVLNSVIETNLWKDD